MYLCECYYSKEETIRELKNKRNTKGKHVRMKFYIYIGKMFVIFYSRKNKYRRGLLLLRFE